MRFSLTALLALAAPLLVWAQANASGPNAFNVPTGGISATAGQDVTLTWKPTTSGTVTLKLRSGASSALINGTVIASSIANSGSYTWSVPSDITRGSDYAVEIIDDTNENNVNYTPYIVIESTNTVASSTGVTSGATSSTTSESSTGTATGSMTSMSSSEAGSSTGTMTSSGSMSTSVSASRTSATASGAVLTSSSAAAGSRATAMAGMLGMAALGALAL